VLVIRRQTAPARSTLGRCFSNCLDALLVLPLQADCEPGRAARRRAELRPLPQPSPFSVAELVVRRFFFPDIAAHPSDQPVWVRSAKADLGRPRVRSLAPTRSSFPGPFEGPSSCRGFWGTGSSAHRISDVPSAVFQNAQPFHGEPPRQIVRTRCVPLVARFSARARPRYTKRATTTTREAVLRTRSRPHVRRAAQGVITTAKFFAE